MKFKLTNVKNGCRLGSLSIKGGVEDRHVLTPTCITYTRAGCVPYVSPDLFPRIGNLPGIVQMPLTLIAEHHENIAKFERGMASFSGLQGQNVFSCVQDPVQSQPTGYNDKLGTSIWTKSGRLKLDVDLFMTIQEAMQPAMYEVLADADTPKDSGKKRLQKSFDRSIKFLDDCLEKHASSARLKQSSIIGVVEGGFDAEFRVKSAKEVAKRPVQGFSIRGFHNFGPDTEKFHFSDVTALMNASTSQLPEDKPRFLPSIVTPDNVLGCIECGIDIFDDSYAYVATERGCALSFDFTLPKHIDSSGEAEDELRAYEMNLNDKKYFDDFGALLKDCTCYTCSTHTRSYINHLLNTSELLGSILLMIHNIHHYSAYFHSIRQALQTDRFVQLKNKILAQKEL